MGLCSCNWWPVVLSEQLESLGDIYKVGASPIHIELVERPHLL